MSVFFIKHPTEAYTIGVDYTNKLPVGVTLASSQVLAAKLDVTKTSLVGSVSAGAITLQTIENVGNGAILTLEPGSPQEEIVLAQSAAGSNPCTVTLVGHLSAAHAAGTGVDYYPGVTVEVLGVTTPIAGFLAQAKVQNGQHGKQYHLNFLVTLSNGDLVEENIVMRVED